MSRSSKDINVEYQNLTFKSGGLQHEIAQKKKDLEMINQTLRDLALEYVSAKKAEDDAVAALAPTTADTEGSAA